MTKYRINDVFVSPQGEGHWTGHQRIFVRFTGCNLRCAQARGPRSPGGFDCDTEFASGRNVTAEELYKWLLRLKPDCNSIVLTGGEPTLQLDRHLVDFLKRAGYWLSIETNGTIPVVPGVDWITVAPKVAEHCLRQTTADEVKYVRNYGQALPKTRVKAKHHYISAAFAGDDVQPDTVEWCQQLVANQPDNGPRWELMYQMHKAWNVR